MWYSFFFFFFCSAIDIKELKILDIRIGNARNNCSTKVGSAPVAVPKGDPRSVEKLNSPQHCSKSYGERHLDVPGQPKAFRRRHNSCKCNIIQFGQVKKILLMFDMLSFIFSHQGHLVVEGQTRWRQKRMGWRMDRWSTEMMSVLEMAWTTGWTQTLILKETWLFLTKQQFSQKLTYQSAVTVQGHVAHLKTRRPHGIVMMKISWRPNLLSTDRLLSHSRAPKSTALVSIYLCTETNNSCAKLSEVNCLILLFHTDSGLVVPSVSYELHKRLLSVAERYGLSLDRRLEMTGVCASQMALTLLGGPNRYVYWWFEGTNETGLGFMTVESYLLFYWILFYWRLI